jgi:uncharacterized protein YjbI with pentapeptide repeats
MTGTVGIDVLTKDQKDRLDSITNTDALSVRHVTIENIISQVENNRRSNSHPQFLKKLLVATVFDGTAAKYQGTSGHCGLSGSAWEECIFVDCIFDNEELMGARFKHCIFIGCAFTNCHLRDANFTHCSGDILTLSWSRFQLPNWRTGTNIDNCKFYKLIVTDNEADGKGGQYKLNRIDTTHFEWKNNSARKMTIENCWDMVGNINALGELRLSLSAAGTKSTGNYTFRGRIILQAITADIDATDADLRESKFGISQPSSQHGSVVGSVFDGADIRLCEFLDVDFRNASFIGTKGLFGPDKARLQNCINQEFANVHRAKFQASWEDIRACGSLFVLGSSGASIVFLITYLRFSNWYNAKISAAKLDTNVTEYLHSVAVALHPLPRPDQIKALLFSLSVLTVASVAFRWVAPNIINEFSLTEWERKYNLPRLEYQSASYSDIKARYVFISVYIAFGGYLLLYLAWRVFEAIFF